MISGLKNANYSKTDKLKMMGATKDIDAISTKDIQVIAKKHVSKGHILEILYPKDKE